MQPKSIKVATLTPLNSGDEAEIISRVVRN